jgi:6-phosphogluconolactonase
MNQRTGYGERLTGANAGDVAREAAGYVASALRSTIGEHQVASLALSGGNTPRDAYARLAREPGIDWSKVSVFWVDERAVAPTDERSNYRWAKATLLDAAPIPEANVHRMPAERPDLEQAARDYERTISQGVRRDSSGIPAIDVVVLGIGDDGHTASLFPGDPAIDERERLVLAVPASGSREARMTLTAPLIEHARQVVILAVGTAKRSALARVMREDGDLHATPARVVRSARGSVTWILDEAAAGVD